MLVILILMATSWETLCVCTGQMRHFCEYFADCICNPVVISMYPIAVYDEKVSKGCRGKTNVKKYDATILNTL